MACVPLPDFRYSLISLYHHRRERFGNTATLSNPNSFFPFLAGPTLILVSNVRDAYDTEYCMYSNCMDFHSKVR